VYSYLVLAVVVSSLFAWTGRHYSRVSRARRTLRAAPRVEIASFPEGAPARIVGRIADGVHLTAPLTRRTCVFYEATVRSSENNRARPIVREVRHVPFAVEDATGRAVVDPTGADFAVQTYSTARTGFDGPSATEAALLARNGFDHMRTVLGRTLYFEERALQVGETVAVYGFGVREPDPDGATRATGYREAVPTVVHISRSKRQPLLLISDYDDTMR